MEETLDNELTNVKSKTIRIENNKAIYRFYDVPADILGEKVNKYLLSKQYKLKSGNATKGVYGKGNKTMRILIGAFVKYFEWNVEIKEDSVSSVLIFSKLAKGYAGGIIGVQQVKNEYKRLTELLSNYCNTLNDSKEEE